jgi:hypothetical protein
MCFKAQLIRQKSDFYSVPQNDRKSFWSTDSNRLAKLTAILKKLGCGQAKTSTNQGFWKIFAQE